MATDSGTSNATAGASESVWRCKGVQELVASSEIQIFLIFVMMVVLSYVAHHFMKPLTKSRITSDIIIGTIIGNVGLLQNTFRESAAQTLNFTIDFGMILYMFVLGLELDPSLLVKSPSQEAMVAYGGLISTFLLVCSTAPFLHFSNYRHLTFSFALATSLSGTASPVLTRLITNLKISKSDIGQLVIAAGTHSDLISSMLLSLGWIIFEFGKRDANIRNGKDAFVMSAGILVQSLVAAKIGPLFMNWVNNENPEGKPMKGSHLVISIAFIVFVCGISGVADYHPMLSAFLTGVFLPRKGRMAKYTIGKINYLLANVFYPLFFFWMGLQLDIRKTEPGNLWTWARLGWLLMISIAGKVIGTVIVGMILGFHLPESVALGLLLAVKGHFHIYLAMVAKRIELISTSTSIVITLVFFIGILYAPFVVVNIIHRARKRSPTHRMALQWLDPSNKLRILLCVHGPQNVASTVNFMEISRGRPDPGVMVYVTDMIELTDQIAATVVHSEGIEGVTVTDQAVSAMRDGVTSTFKTYVDENGDGITLRRMLALSTFNGMPQDICSLAEELMIALIVLPFHKNQRADGKLDEGHSGFRYVNRKVLRTAPCSVGILVDRGFGLIDRISSTYICLNVAVIFIGGKDDREALAYAGRIAWHPGVKLTVLRFLVDTDAENATRRTGIYRSSTSEQEEEVKLDDECFAEFYEKQVAGGRVAYTEKHLANSAETYSTLRSLEGQYSLVIVGRGIKSNSVLTVGMSDWQQCPELGPIGDILSGSEFLITTSVLIIHQPDIKGKLDGLDDDFSIM